MSNFDTSTLSTNVLTMESQENEVGTLIFLIINNSLIDHNIFKWCCNLGNGRRLKQSYLPCGCTAKLRLNFQSHSNQMVITTLKTEHCIHPTQPLEAYMKGKLKWNSPKNSGKKKTDSDSNSGTLQMTLLTEIWPNSFLNTSTLVLQLGKVYRKINL